MQIHKKDIVWPEAGVVRKRGIEREKKGRKDRRRHSHWPSSLLCNIFQCLFHQENIE